MTEQETLFYSIGNEINDSIKSQMFGKPCFKINTKAFVCFFQDCMVFKVTGETHQEALSSDGSELFDPSGKGRAMKEWVQVPYDYKDKWAEYAKQAYEYVSGQQAR
ncbi:MAG: hypothetical protein COA58_16060 [Bacteroidetes bacterium]|nr:MAG: hypothetical protein COA58_16060 [Bacteroidota bacterium]